MIQEALLTECFLFYRGQRLEARGQGWRLCACRGEFGRIFASICINLVRMNANLAKTYRELIVWQKSMDLAEETYRISRRFPKHELYGLASQLQRASVSVASNIAEGHARKSRKEFVHHLSYSKGSIAEIETQMILATRLGYISRDEIREFWNLAQEVGKMLSTMINTLSTSSKLSFWSGLLSILKF